MNKYFNTTGFCRPDWHYMVEPFRGLKGAFDDLIERRQFFIIHAPRQTGKTTLLRALAHQLNKDGKYIAVASSLESAGWQSITENLANKRIIESLYARSQDFLPLEYCPPKPENSTTTLHDYLRAWSVQQEKEIVLLLDEIDALYDDILVSILRQLRDGFQSRPKAFPAVVALVGLRDIRDYQLKARGNNPSLGAGSPFNIKAESFFLPVFSLEDIRNLYTQHTTTTGQVFEEGLVERVKEISGGQPWLVNALMQDVVDRLLKKDYSQEVSIELIEEAKERLIARRDTHLDSLTDKLKEERVARVVMTIINGDTPIYDNFDDDLSYCLDLGIVKILDGEIRFANLVYQEIINRLMNSSLQYSYTNEQVQQAWYVLKNGNLDMDALLRAFQEFYRRHAEHWLGRFKYKEAGHQLMLTAFLQRVVNGGGRIEREMAVGRGRTDIVVIWKDEVFVLELKLKYYEDIKEEGLEQLWAYLDRLNLNKGYLILFELKDAKTVKWEERIFWEVNQYKEKELIVLGM